MISLPKERRELNLNSYMLVQFCSWFQFYVPWFKSQALLYTTMTKKGENIIMSKVYIETLHVHNQISSI